MELAARNRLTLMVGFNRRFSPLYRELKTQLSAAASVRMDKHRLDSVRPHDLRFTLLDDYLHVIDTILWLAERETQLDSGQLITNDAGEMLLRRTPFLLRPFATDHQYASSCRKSARVCSGGD